MWRRNKKKNEYLRKRETKLHCRNLIKRIHNWTVILVRYTGSFLKWTREKFQKNELENKRHDDA